MSKLYSFLIPSSPTATTLFSGALTAGTPLTNVTGFKTIVGVGLFGASDAASPGVAHVRFGSAAKPPTATAGDWLILAGGTLQFFELGSEFDRISIFTAATGVSYVMYVFSNL